MTKRVLSWSGTILVLAMATWFTVPLSGRTVSLRSRHSEPTATPPPAQVAVTPQGKLYHRPDCLYIHGPIRLEPGEEAKAAGFTPCTRCLKR
jgi:hypothetical protein